MKLSGKTIGAIIGLMSLALLGLIAIQLYLLDHALELKKQAFRQNVNAALSSIVQTLETGELVGKVLDVTVKVPSPKRIAVIGMNVESNTNSVKWVDSLVVAGGFVPKEPQVKIDGNKVWYHLPTPQHVRLMLYDSLSQRTIHVIDEFKPAGQHEVELKTAPIKKGMIFASFTTDSTSFFTKVEGERNDAAPQLISNQKKMLIVRKVLDDITRPHGVPFEARVAPAILDSVVGSTLAAKGIATSHAYGVISVPRDSLRLATPAKYTGELKRSEFRSRLFPNDIFAAADDLVLFFPQQNIYLLKQMVGLLSSSFVLLAVVVFGFVYTVRTIFKQRQFAGLLVEFINNMTHEFKTPISTVALASEALTNPEIAKDESRLLRYSRIIRDENTRMRNQVEKILEMAALEEGDYELNLTPVDVHQVVTDAVQNIALQIEKRGGKIDCRLEAPQHVIEGDEVHLTNIIHNLLDNANKYSPGTPKIVIATANSKEGLHIRLNDNGIGLRAEEQKRVFEKYYRVPTGNVHDVKGFGLGLSYVKLMVEAHGGTIALKSELKKGSEFDICLPLRQKNFERG